MSFYCSIVWDAKGVGEEGEIRQGRKLVDAAKAAGVKHFVWSYVSFLYRYTYFQTASMHSSPDILIDTTIFIRTLEYNTKPVAAHWKSKAIVDDYLKASGIPRTSYVKLLHIL